MPGSDPVESLVLDLLEWIGAAPRPYAEVLDAWRTSCPRLPVWEEANDRGFIKRHRSPADGPLVSVSASGARYLRLHRRRSP
jgi:D-3-phosphoglycerate dehydrogenase